jgi:predicted N-acetyltransferase YhbS
MHLKAQAGWNQTEADWLRFLQLSSHSCFIARCDGRDAGTVACFVFADVAWIAMVLVDEEFRGRGIGKALMHHALDHLDSRGVASVRLDATDLGRPLYERLGFAAQFQLTRYQGVPDDTATWCGLGAIVRSAEPADLPAIWQLDAEATATDRKPLLDALMRQYPSCCRVACRRGRVVGYAMTRPGAQATQIGPVVALSHHMEPSEIYGLKDDMSSFCGSGNALLQDALARSAGDRVYIDVPHGHAAAALLADAGLTAQRTFTRMCRGRQVLETVPHLWASSGPEKG